GSLRNGPQGLDDLAGRAADASSGHVVSIPAIRRESNPPDAGRFRRLRTTVRHGIPPGTRTIVFRHEAMSSAVVPQTRCFPRFARSNRAPPSRLRLKQNFRKKADLTRIFAHYLT